MTPPSEDSGAGAPLERLHPLVILVWASSQLLPVAFLLLAGRAVIVAVVALAISGLAGGVRWSRFRWGIQGGALVVEQGLIRHQRRVVPLERVQSVDLVRSLRHRLFGVVEVRVEAVGGGATEAKLDALSPEDAERLRATLLRSRSPAPAEEVGAPADQEQAPAARPLVHLRPGALVLAGLTGGRVGVAAALIGVAQQVFGERLLDVFSVLPDTLGLSGFVALGIAAVSAAFLLSVVATILTYWDFTLTRDGGDLRVSRGLLDQRMDTVRLRRVQALRIEENLLRRPLGLAAVKVDVAGRTRGEDAAVSALLLPLGSAGDAADLVADLLGVPGLARVELAPMPPAARTRRLTRAAVFTMAATAAGVVAFGPPGLLLLLLALPAGALALDAYRSLGRAELDGIVVARTGVLVRRTAFVPADRLQSLALEENPFQRRLGLATVDLQIARSPGAWRGPRLVDVDRRDGEKALRELAAS